MTAGQNPDGLKLTEEEAFALLGLCLTSPIKLDVNSEIALKKLAEYCTNSSLHAESNARSPMTSSFQLVRELGKAGA